MCLKYNVVFQTKDGKWTIVQQRSPTIKGKREEYLEHVYQFASQFPHILVFTSMDASRRMDSQIQGEPFRVYGEGPLLMRAVSLGIPVLENFELEDGQDTNSDNSKVHLPGSGLARHVYQRLNEHTDINLVVMFALEGGKREREREDCVLICAVDNVQDGIEYARFLNTLLKIQPPQEETTWKIPESWKYLFGTPFNAELYQ